jgi:hypothetical protein
MFSRSYIFLFFCFFVLVGCKSKKKISLSGEEPVAITDFIEFFQPLSLPYQLSDTVFLKKDKDSLLISYKNFSQFVPDSLLRSIYNKGVKPKIYALGKAVEPKAEKYLFVKTVSGDKKALFILAFDKNDKYVAGMPLLKSISIAGNTHSFVFDKRFTLTKILSRKNRDGSISEGKDVYVLNAAAGGFSLIMTDALEDKVTELINPIDTLPRKNKWSADYSNGKMNMVSVRDGRKIDRITFFIHFEKNNGECSGEIKGEAMITSASTAEFKEEGDPCRLKFIFSPGSVTLKEEEACGSRRGLKCTFDGSFARKKNSAAPAEKKAIKK